MIVQMWKQENKIFNIIKPEVSSGFWIKKDGREKKFCFSAKLMKMEP